MENNNSQKGFAKSFLNIKQSVGKNGNYTSFTLISTVIHPEVRDTQTGKRVASARVAINGQAEAIRRHFPNIPADTDGTIWATVNVWDQSADWFMKSFEAAERRRMVLTGSMAENVFTNKEGQDVHGLKLSCDAFRAIDRVQPSAGQASAPASAPATAPAAAPAAAAGTILPGGFVELDEDGEVPF